MPYYHLKEYDNSIKRECVCGGKPQMILDIVQDYIVRCEKCHKSTNVYMSCEDAVKAWENNRCTGPLNLLTDDLERHLENIKFIYISGEDFFKISKQSCDCIDVVIDTGDGMIGLEHESEQENGWIGFDELCDFDRKTYEYKVDLSKYKFKLDKLKYYDGGLVEAIRYKCDDVFLFIFADEYNFIITMSKYDLFEETKTDILEAEEVLEIQKNI